MLSYLKDFILNIFVIFTPLLMFPYIFKTKSRTLLYRLFIYLLFSTALVLTMSIPVNLNGLTYDFRSIPLSVGSLYGGWQVASLLYATLLACRYFMGNPNELYYAIGLLPSFALVVWFLRYFSSLRLAGKIAMAVTLCTLVKLLTFGLYLTMIGQLGLLMSKPWATLQTYLLQGVIVGLSVYVIEFLKKYYYMQEEFFKSEKMKIVGDMAASVAHEIRNPLTTVRGFIQLLGTAELDSGKKDYYKRICFDELDRAELIITDYLSLAKPDPEVIESINLNDEVQYLANVLLTYANYNNIQINVALAEEQAPCVVGDRYKFRQAMVNIGKNAIEAMQGGGVLDLKTDKLNGQAVIVISDTGHGMTAEQMKRLGTPYYSTKEKGTGLGTMVSFGIIRKMSGKIDMKSELGKGTEFKLIFPNVA
ncbi:ATP-binding protein [Paenibacillus arenilitoris]|uniref:histidine kinase n=1 Tax=Paenibacillus arenilitoris TaxID=2772299 RepID=A0A927CNJ5_9BACL|nr:ATP-binding protein [Paenibacillus arenilitoris]MBD2871348.1 hypothetical protein [Paenibacillus arenilitoris]